MEVYSWQSFPNSLNLFPGSTVASSKNTPWGPEVLAIPVSLQRGNHPDGYHEGYSQPLPCGRCSTRLADEGSSPQTQANVSRSLTRPLTPLTHLGEM